MLINSFRRVSFVSSSKLAIRPAYTLRRLHARSYKAGFLSSNIKTLAVIRHVRSYATGTATSKPRAKRASTTKRSRKAPKKAATKKKSKAKKAVKKAKKPKKRVAKPKSPEALQKLKLQTLRQKALQNQPKPLPTSAWNLYIAQRTAKSGQYSPTGQFKELASEFKSLSPAELEALNRTSVDNAEANTKALNSWVTQHTAEDIHKANIARRSLARLGRAALKAGNRRPAGTSGQAVAKLLDERRAKPPTAFAAFVKSRWASGDLKGIAAVEAMRLISQDWKSLSAAEKADYK